MHNFTFETDLMAIFPEKLLDVVEARKNYKMTMSAEKMTEVIEAASNRSASKFKNVKGNIAVLPIHGYISHRATIWAALGFEASSEMFGMWFDAAMDDASIGAIIIDINSPGGTVSGITSIGDKIFNARGKKPIIAVSNSLMASAAYWIGSSADEVVADPDSMNGCVGTISVHMDHSKYLEDAGIDVTIFTAGKFKGEGNPYEQLTPEAKGEFQRTVDAFAAKFYAAVARNRNVSIADVKANFGQGRCLMAEDARAVNMVDRVATMGEVIERVRSEANNGSTAGRRNSRARAQVDVAKAQLQQMEM